MPRTGPGYRKNLTLTCIHLIRKSIPWVNIVNIISGAVAPPLINVENTVYTGEGMLEDFKDAWPEGCYNAITKRGYSFL